MERRQITLKAARINAGLSQDEAAKALGITQQTISSYEKGESYPRVPMIKKIEDLYGVSYNDLIFF